MQTRREYLMTCLIEEANELAQAGCKVLRFIDLGPTRENEPKELVPHIPTALQMLNSEWNDIVAIYEMLWRENIVMEVDDDKVKAKTKRVEEHWDYVQKRQSS